MDTDRSPTARRRKDYYEFAYVLIYNRLGGPAQAAREIKGGTLRTRIPSMGTVWRKIGVRFDSPDRAGPKGYAVQARLIDPSPDESRLRQDAVAAVAEFLSELGRR